MLYAYIKKKNKRSFLAQLPSPRETKRRLPRKVIFLLSLMFFLVGSFFLGQVAYPIAAWYLWVSPKLPPAIATPLASSFYLARGKTFPAVVKATERNANLGEVDSYNVSNWFVGASQGKDEKNNFLKTYTLTIPKLQIDSATVEVGGEDLKKSLIAWPTSALPGSYGKNIIFGHSELPQFASPKDYAGIFTHLMELKKGDEVLIDYDGVRYRYEVIGKNVISPTDLSVLEQRFDSSYVTLITCTPPGTTWKRGVVTARLAKAD